MRLGKDTPCILPMGRRFPIKASGLLTRRFRYGIFRPLGGVV
jgi:hypothetical protein